MENKTKELIKAKYPDRIPVIVDIDTKSKDIPPLDKCKFLLPNDLTWGQFLYVIRKRIKLKPEKSIFMFINNTLPNTAQLVQDTYKQLYNCDGIMKVVVSSENTFG